MGFKIDPNDLPRPRQSTILRLLMKFATRRGRACFRRGIAVEAPPGMKGDPTIRLIQLWNYTVIVKAENLKLAGR